MKKFLLDFEVFLGVLWILRLAPDYSNASFSLFSSPSSDFSSSY
jgi:hypothetical protein